eukprot:CAMPEP_0181314266 /NCGR_PEP_ID=MMETSP1101-20121128/14719_1 /TAXON_ID=46948 /ORGANISM="Rhodomonas abbreviata, Strain Caron Lab Isolate" /LENGTH=221 /DNA_ID=CAMNT_0023421333 /DNA_START=80 /DNA_END=742 /DNA_ORIENTATION=-
MSGFSSFFSSVSNSAKQMAQQVSENVKPMADKVKAQAASIDTSKVSSAVSQVGQTASEAFSQARMAAEPQLAQARESAMHAREQAVNLASQQAKQFSKANAKSLLHAKASFGVPLDVVSFRTKNYMHTEVAQVPAILDTLLAFLEHAEPSEPMHVLLVTQAKADAVKPFIKALDTDINAVDMAACKDVHVVATALRHWLVELPEPLLSYNAYDPFINAGYG